MTNKLDNITLIPEAFAPSALIAKNEQEMLLSMKQYIGRISQDKALTDGDKIKTGSLSIIDFFTLIKNTIYTRQKTEKVISGHEVLFIEDDPPEDLDTEAITYEMTLREPGSFSQGSAGMGQHKEVRAHTRIVADDPDKPGMKLIQMGRFYDHIITFYCYARTSKVALKRALWLEKLIDSFNWYYKYYGFTVVESKIMTKEDKKIGNLHIKRYPLSYIVRTDDTYYISEQELRELMINLNVLSG